MSVDRAQGRFLTVAILGLALLALSPVGARAHAGHDQDAQAQAAPLTFQLRLPFTTAGGTPHSDCAAAVIWLRADGIDRSAGGEHHSVCLGGCCTPGSMSCCPISMPPTNDMRPPSVPRLHRAALADRGEGIEPDTPPEPPRV